MKKLILTGLFLAIVAAAFLAAYASGDNQTANTAGTLPATLGNFYPPSAHGPVYLFTMLDMAPPFSGIMSDLMEGEPENVKANFESFKAKYYAAAELVPEWKNDFGLPLVEELGKAVNSGDQEKIIAAFQAVGNSCVGCHVKNSTAVQHKYYWGDFGIISAADPITNNDVSYMQFMFMIESDFSGIGVDVAQGQIENALRHVYRFERRYLALKEICGGCHDSARQYYVDDKVFGMIAGLKAKLQEKSLDPNGIGELLQGIGVESCYKCHVVHTPAAYARARVRYGHEG